MEKYQNKYRTTSTRLQNWDYQWRGAYFITICTHNRTHYFGEINNDKMQLSNIGIIADVLWFEIKNHAHNVELGEFIVMPNHIHGILILNNDNVKHGNGNVETRHALSLQSQPQLKTIGQKRFQNQGKNTVSSIIGSYKSAVTKHVHRLGYDFKWQSRFWEHIIRNEHEYQRIAQYIIDNPKKWAMDKLNGGVGNQVMEPMAEYTVGAGFKSAQNEVWMI